MQVLIMTSWEKDDEKTLLFRIVTEQHGLSPVLRREVRGRMRHGNPYLLYGKEVEEFTGLKAAETTINVFDATSGGL